MMILNKVVFLLFIAVVAASSSCGEGKISINDASFEPRIVIQGTLIPDRIAQVRIMRNFPVNTSVGQNDLILTNANVVILDATGKPFNLRYNSRSAFYETPTLLVEYGQTYTLQVTASIDGKELSATSTTTVPEPGFAILAEKSRLGSMIYRQRDANGELMDFELVFNRSPGTDYYAMSVTALDADTSTFIYRNPFGDFNVDDVLDDFNDFRYNYDWIQDTPLTPGESNITIYSFYTWFYGDYRVILYAADRNFRDFLSTFNSVQEIDGNFHEPAFHIEGDGIGVFGSAIADTAYFTVLRE